MKLFFWTSFVICILASAIAALYYNKHQLVDVVSAASEIVNSYYDLTDYTPTALRLNKNQQQNQQQQQQQQQEDSHHHRHHHHHHHLFANEMSVHRAIRQVFLAVEQAEGAGARVRRSIGTPKLRNFSPFLMLDHFSIKPGAGFPDHPHRGQETITYLLQGGVDHEDFAGNKGTISSGDLQFMTAGRGIVHAEMPRQNPDGSANVGLQLWVDLPSTLKATEPRYRDLRAAEIPRVDVDEGRATVKVISGQSHGVDSVKDLAYTPVWILDVELRPGGKVTQPLPQTWNAFSYVLEGDVYYGQGDKRQKVEQYHITVFDREGDVVHVEAPADATKNSRLVIVAGTPLDQPVVQYGPFVLTTKEDVYKALMDYQSFSNGFERAKDWRSEIGKSMMD
ncbi:Pirin-like protein [Hapsidospora chrysogenum ATCC 11550]|uniref:Pirin-like protein n=1 Tax=Hapsidospora chrysogenum (strain ATCC 11550 / CBS 779.69 / DSM 880 / IAM 14645 / JCM 23072 / IMI 49137) TaxID=857340 RepID=A0A086T624_HAPC1|nr:Pirin-like protein [Hapsidospora chrysogenum ATCC 11550]